MVTLAETEMFAGAAKVAPLVGLKMLTCGGWLVDACAGLRPQTDTRKPMTRNKRQTGRKKYKSFMSFTLCRHATHSERPQFFEFRAVLLIARMSLCVNVFWNLQRRLRTGGFNRLFPPPQEPPPWKPSSPRPSPPGLSRRAPGGEGEGFFRVCSQGSSVRAGLANLATLGLSAGTPL